MNVCVSHTVKVKTMGDDRGAAGFTDLYREHYGRVLRFVGRRVGLGGDAEDATAEVFRIAWTEVCRGSDKVTLAWLFATAHNVLRNRYRSVQRAGRLHEAMADDIRTQQGTDPAQESVRAAIDMLREGEREILILRYWDGLDGREMAEVLNVSTSTVWVRLHRARRAFQTAFTKISGGDRAFR